MIASPPQPALREFVRPISRHRWLLLVVVVASVAAAIAYSASQRRVYTATASIGFQDYTSDLAVVGIAVPPAQTATQVASAAAQVVHSPQVVARVRERLGSAPSGVRLPKKVGATVDATSNLVDVSAEVGSARDAQRLANAYGLAATEIYNERSRAAYTAQAAALRKHRPSKKTASPEALSLYNVQISRLKTLSTISEPARVVESARQPHTPTSPKPVRNAVAGGFLGLVLGLALVFLRDSFDRRLHSPRDIEAEMGLPLIGHIRDAALGRLPGANGKLSLDTIDWEQFRILRRNLDFLDPETPPGSIAVTSALPEEGKTTVALFLALASAAAGQKTLLIECDLRRPVLASRLPELVAAPGLTDFVAGRAQPAEVLQTVSLDENQENGSLAAPARQVVCITAGSPTKQPVEVLGSERFRQMLEEVKERYDVVILDTPPMLPLVDVRELLPRVSAVVVCVRAERITRDQVRAERAALERIPPDGIALVVTGTSRADERAYGYYGYGD